MSFIEWFAFACLLHTCGTVGLYTWDTLRWRRQAFALREENRALRTRLFELQAQNALQRTKYDEAVSDLVEKFNGRRAPPRRSSKWGPS